MPVACRVSLADVGGKYDSDRDCDAYGGIYRDRDCCGDCGGNGDSDSDDDVGVRQPRYV